MHNGSYFWNFLMLTKVSWILVITFWRKYSSYILSPWVFLSGVGPLWFPIGCFVNKINKFLSLVVHARRYCLNSFYHLLGCENEFDIQWTDMERSRLNLHITSEHALELTEDGRCSTQNSQPLTRSPIELKANPIVMKTHEKPIQVNIHPGSILLDRVCKFSEMQPVHSFLRVGNWMDSWLANMMWSEIQNPFDLLESKLQESLKEKREHVNPSQPDDPYSSTDFYVIR